jgi:hypothetical protein
MKTSFNQRGSSHLILLVAVLVIAAVAFVGFRVRNDDSPLISSTSNGNTNLPKAINSPADLNKADKALDATNVDSVNPNQLDSELNSL